MEVCRRRLIFDSTPDTNSSVVQPLEKVDPCCICGDNTFATTTELAAHLIKHVEDYVHQGKLEEPVYESPAVNISSPMRFNYPEYTSTDFGDKDESSSGVSSSQNPVVLHVDLDSDDEEIKIISEQ